jgi:hypothetical protein
MIWLVRLYPAPWRARYGEEFAAVLASQRVSLGLVLDVIGGAIDAHLSPQIGSQGQISNSEQIEGEEKMAFAMLHRCAAGGPKLSPDERRIASRLAIFSALGMAILYLLLTKINRGAPAVQAVFYTSICSSFTYEQMAYLRNRSRLAKALIVAAELSAVYVFMLGVCLLAGRL